MKKNKIYKNEVWKASSKNQFWEWKMTKKAHEKDWSRIISSAIETCQNIEAHTKDSQRYEN